MATWPSLTPYLQVVRSRFARLPPLVLTDLCSKANPVACARPGDGFSLFLSSLLALLQFRGKTEVPTLDLRGSGMSRCRSLSMPSYLSIHIEGAGSHITTLLYRLSLNMQL